MAKTMIKQNINAALARTDIRWWNCIPAHIWCGFVDIHLKLSTLIWVDNACGVKRHFSFPVQIYVNKTAPNLWWNATTPANVSFSQCRPSMNTNPINWFFGIQTHETITHTSRIFFSFMPTEWMPLFLLCIVYLLKSST